MAEEKNFNEQAYLMWDHFVENYSNTEYRASDLSKLSSKIGMTFHKVVGNYQPGEFMSKFVSKNNKFKRYESFMDLENHKISSLIPEVKLFKIDINKYIPFYFPEAAERTTASSLLSHGSSLGSVGIRSFNVKFVGKDFFTMDKMLDCSLSIYTDSMENIFKDPNPGFAQLSDLFTISAGKSKKFKGFMREKLSKEVTSEQVSKPFSHEIGAMIGYAIPEHGGMFTSQERQAIQNTNLMLRMTYTGHSISISGDGQTNIDITFTGRIESSLGSSMHNIIATRTQLTEISRIQSDINTLKSSSNPDQAKTKEAIQRLEALRDTEIRKRLNRIITNLEKNDKIKTAAVSPKMFAKYNNFISPEQKESTEEKEAAPKEKPSDKKEPVNEKSTQRDKKPSENDLSIQYYYMGDFVAAVVATLVEEQNAALKQVENGSESEEIKKAKKEKINEAISSLKSYKVLFGNVPIYTGNEKVVIKNLSDIPVSAKVIAQYFIDDLVQRNVKRFVLSEFLEKLVTRIYPMVMNSHLYRDASALHDPVSVSSTIISGPEAKTLQQRVDISDLPDVLRAQSDVKKSSGDIDYYVIYADMTSKETVSRKGNRKSDNKDGIYHFNLSKDRGLIKAISFSQENVQYRREALMLESVSLFDELKMPYNANISMFGNTLFMPGSMIYINPASIGFGDPRNQRSAASRLGIGGYYTIISVSISYSNGTLVTDLDARHQSWAEDGNVLSTLQELEFTGITAEAKKRVDKGTTPVDAIGRVFR